MSCSVTLRYMCQPCSSQTRRADLPPPRTVLINVRWKVLWEGGVGARPECDSSGHGKERAHLLGIALCAEPRGPSLLAPCRLHDSYWELWSPLCPGTQDLPLHLCLVPVSMLLLLLGPSSQPLAPRLHDQQTLSRIRMREVGFGVCV